MFEGVERDFRYYNKLMRSLILNGADFSVLDMLAEMETANCPPNKVTTIE